MCILTIRRFSVIGFLLFCTSAIIAAMLPKNENRNIGPGVLVDSLGPNNTAQKTCKQNSGLNQCTYTATGGGCGVGSRTTTQNSMRTSSITTANCINKTKTITDSPEHHSSQSPL